MEAVGIKASAGSGNISFENAEGNRDISVGSGNIRTDFDNLLEWNRKGNEAQGSYGGSSSIRIRTQASGGNTTVVLQ